MLNRSAVIVRPKKPFCDWLRAVDYENAPEVTLDEMGPTLYLVPDFEDPADAIYNSPTGSRTTCLARDHAAGAWCEGWLGVRWW